MGTSLQEKIASLPSERQARIKDETAHLQATYMTLKDLRRAHDMTQAHLAKQLGKSRDNDMIPFALTLSPDATSGPSRVG